MDMVGLAAFPSLLHPEEIRSDGLFLKQTADVERGQSAVTANLASA